LKQLNPALRGLSTPPGYADFQLIVPPGSTPEIHLKIASLPEVKIRPQTNLASRHKVQSGDTLDKIARKYGTSVAALKSANRISSANTLKAGTWIRIPTRTTTAPPKPAPAKVASVKRPVGTAVKSGSKPIQAAAGKGTPPRKPIAKAPIKSSTLPLPKAPAKSSKSSASVKKSPAKEIASR
jgi:murein DD-endopeptidase MepM/ murein hydrolase activator NlpD